MRSYSKEAQLAYEPEFDPDEWAEDADEEAFYALPEDGGWAEEQVWSGEESFYLEEIIEDWQPPNMLVVLVVACVVVLVTLGGLVGMSGNVSVEQVPGTAVAGPNGNLDVDDPTAVVAPYDEYTLTQGLHGQSYGHLAIDVAAGRGEAVKSPINGRISNLYIDEYGNTTLVIENQVYLVTMLHGDFSAAIGDELTAGQVVGSEGNNGYTMDYFGNLCYGRVYCGNHTHLNIFDKRLQANVNPLDLIQ